jgi:hypothetical protein
VLIKGAPRHACPLQAKPVALSKAYAGRKERLPSHPSRSDGGANAQAGATKNAIYVVDGNGPTCKTSSPPLEAVASRTAPGLQRSHTIGPVLTSVCMREPIGVGKAGPSTMVPDLE